LPRSVIHTVARTQSAAKVTPIRKGAVVPSKARAIRAPSKAPPEAVIAPNSAEAEAKQYEARALEVRKKQQAAPSGAE
jgi:hypothetical protein